MKDKSKYSWLVPLLGIFSLVCFAFWYALFGHQGFFGVVVFFGKIPPLWQWLSPPLFWGYLIPVGLFGWWFGQGILDAIRGIFGAREYTWEEGDEVKTKRLNNFIAYFVTSEYEGTVDAPWKRVLIFVVILVGLYAVPMLIFAVIVLALYYFIFFGGAASGASGGGGGGGGSEASGVSDLEETYQYTSGINNRVGQGDVHLSGDQKRDLKIATRNLDHNSSKDEIDTASKTIKRVAGEVGATKDPYVRDKGEVYTSEHPGNERNNKGELAKGIKSEIKKMTNK